MLQKQREYRQRHRDEINDRRRELRRMAREKGENYDRKKPDEKVTPGRVCTDCVRYLNSYSCSESFFKVVSCGIHIAETCLAYEKKSCEMKE